MIPHLAQAGHAVIAAAGAVALATITASVRPQWRRIVRLAGQGTALLFREMRHG